MKIQYLAFIDRYNPEKGLRSITRKEWDEILLSSRNCPKENCRYFIHDDIYDCGKIDRIYIETTKDDYMRWHSEYEKTKYNWRFASNYTILSGNVLVEPDISLFDAIPDSMDVEEFVLSRLQIQELKDAIVTWKSWGADMLNYYLGNKEKKLMIKELSAKYHVSEQTVRKWKRYFEEFVLEFFSKKL